MKYFIPFNIIYLRLCYIDEFLYFMTVTRWLKKPDFFPHKDIIFSTASFINITIKKLTMVQS